MITYLLQDPLAIRIAQALCTLVLVALVLLLARYFRIALFREGSLALLRGLIQVVAVGGLLLAVFQGPHGLSVLVLMAMIVVAAQIAAKRATELPRARWVAFWSIFMAAGGSITLMVVLGIIATPPSSLIPIGSMLIANSMNTIAQAFERLQSDIKSHVGQIEVALSLGASPSQAIAPMVEAAVQASLIPRIDTMRSLGIVWIPGLMTGMLLAGQEPLQSALYQFVVVALILGVGALASLTSSLLIRPYLFSDAEQLLFPSSSQQNHKDHSAN